MSDSPADTPACLFRVAARSDVGMRRATNQDSLAVLPTPNGEPIAGDAFLMVADGMGAHAAGELASKMATDAIPHSYLKSASESAPSALRRAIRDANSAIYAKGSSSPEFMGMGTTCTCLVATQGSALVGHVGDSRVYRLRDGVLEQLTFDHSLVWEMAAASNVSADKVPSCIPKNVITRSLGPHDSVNVDLEGPHQLEPGDTYLLCSDGLTGVIDDPLAGGVIGALPPDEAAETLIDLANLRGGPDNISVVVARVECAKSGDPAGASKPPNSGGASGMAVGAAAACVIGLGWFLMAGHTLGAIGSAIGLGATIAYALAQRGATSVAATPKTLAGAYGNGPYRRTECGDLASAAGDLRDLVRELASLDSDEDTVRPDEAAASIEVSPGPLPGGMLLEWGPFEADHQKAERAFKEGDHRTAVAAFSGVIRAVMEAVRSDDGTRRFTVATDG